MCSINSFKPTGSSGYLLNTSKRLVCINTWIWYPQCLLGDGLAALRSQGALLILAGCRRLQEQGSQDKARTDGRLAAGHHVTFLQPPGLAGPTQQKQQHQGELWVGWTRALARDHSTRTRRLVRATSTATALNLSVLWLTCYRFSYKRFVFFTRCTAFISNI